MADEFDAEESKLVSERNLASQAKGLLDNPMLVEAFAGLRSNYENAWRAAKVTDLDGMQQIKIALVILDQVEGHLKHAVKTGTLADTQLAIIQRTREAQDGPATESAWYDREMEPGERA